MFQSGHGAGTEGEKTLPECLLAKFFLPSVPESLVLARFQEYKVVTETKTDGQVQFGGQKKLYKVRCESNSCRIRLTESNCHGHDQFDFFLQVDFC